MEQEKMNVAGGIQRGRGDDRRGRRHPTSPGPGPGVASAGTEDATFISTINRFIYKVNENMSLLVYRLVHAPVMLTGRAKAGFDSPTERCVFCFYRELTQTSNVKERVSSFFIEIHNA